METDRSWVIIKVRPFKSEPWWVLSNRKLTSSEVDALFHKGHYHFNFNEFGLPYSTTGSLIEQMVVCHGSTKKEAQDACDRYNNGHDPWKDIIGEEEEYLA